MGQKPSSERGKVIVIEREEREEPRTFASNSSRFCTTTSIVYPVPPSTNASARARIVLLMLQRISA